MEAMRVYDLIGIGFGPSNIALAIAIEELQPDLDAVFLEARPSTSWHPGMMFPGSDIQNHPLRDLVTPRNPCSKYSFTNFLFETGRLFAHLNLGMLFPLRVEYAQYVAWAADHFTSRVRYGCEVNQLDAEIDSKGHISGYRIVAADGSVFHSRAVAVAPGRTPYVPALFDAAQSERVIHLNDYLPAIEKLMREKPTARVAVVGGSQSAVEILLHLTREYPDTQSVGFLRRFGYRVKDTSPFTGEVYFPEFVDLFFNADRRTKARLRADLHLTNYSAADADVLDELYRTIYQQNLTGRQRTTIYRSTDIHEVVPDRDGVLLHFHRGGERDAVREHFDLVILATGFRDIGPGEHQETCPPLLRNLLPRLHTGSDGCICIRYDYSIEQTDPAAEAHPCYVNGLCESSHGMGDAGSFSLLSLRSKAIVESLNRRLGSSPQCDERHVTTRFAAI